MKIVSMNKILITQNFIYAYKSRIKSSRITRVLCDKLKWTNEALTNEGLTKLMNIHSYSGEHYSVCQTYWNQHFCQSTMSICIYLITSNHRFHYIFLTIEWEEEEEAEKNRKKFFLSTKLIKSNKNHINLFFIIHIFSAMWSINWSRSACKRSTDQTEREW